MSTDTVSIKVSWCLLFWQKALGRTGTYHLICIFAFHYAHNCIPSQQFFPTISENIISDVWNKCLNVTNWRARNADLCRISFFWELPWYDSLLNFLFVFDNTKRTEFLCGLFLCVANREEVKELYKYNPFLLAVSWDWLNICNDSS